MEAPRLIASLARIVRDIGVAEDLAQDALVAALEQWPGSGVPRNPGAWLMAAAKHRAIDRWRREKLLERKHQELGYDLEAQQEMAGAGLEASLDDDVGDACFGCVFTACHPDPLHRGARGADAPPSVRPDHGGEIARAFLTWSRPSPRIVRAKGQTLAKERVPFEVPRGAPSPPAVLGLESSTRLTKATRRRPATTGCGRALRRRAPSGTHRAELAPQEPEAHGLVRARDTASRAKARAGPSGAPILLLGQTAACGSPADPARAGGLGRAEARRGRGTCAPGRDLPRVTRGRLPEDTNWRALRRSTSCSPWWRPHRSWS